MQPFARTLYPTHGGNHMGLSTVNVDPFTFCYTAKKFVNTVQFAEKEVIDPDYLCDISCLHDGINET